jgi:hypothetical protein
VICSSHCHHIYNLKSLTSHNATTYNSIDVHMGIESSITINYLFQTTNSCLLSQQIYWDILKTLYFHMFLNYFWNIIHSPTVMSSCIVALLFSYLPPISKSSRIMLRQLYQIYLLHFVFFNDWYSFGFFIFISPKIFFGF